MNNVRQVREAKQVTQVQLAERTGLVQQYISRLELGLVSNPRTATRRKIAAALAVPESDLWPA